MGPLIPQGFVNPDLNLFFAFVIGLGFGYILEQAGFSSSRKLAGVFYGYDFVVLRVFFTAAITAMTGLLLFNYLGWIDYSLLYINPTFLWSAIVGGVIMGFGFILGGFCPGTSLAGAVIGKIDAMFFIGGMFIGIFIFGEFYSLFEPLYLGFSLGPVFVFDSLGMSREWFALLLILVALTAFAITQRIEDKVNNTPSALKEARPSHSIPAFLVILAGLILLVLPPQTRSNWKETEASLILEEMLSGNHLSTPDEVAYGIMQGKKYPLQLVDVRDASEFQRFSLPGAIHIPLAEIGEKKWKPLLQSPNHKVILFSYSDTRAAEAWLISRRSGIEGIRVLQGGLNAFTYTFFLEEISIERERPDCIEMHTARFREKARDYFQSGKAEKEPEQAPVPVIQIIDIDMPASGGC
jgi:hypothetical protein